MTQILALTNSDYVLVASDRRICGVAATKTRIFDDDTNKLVFNRGFGVFSYSGLAILDGLQTYRWLGLKLVEIGPENTVTEGINDIGKSAEISVKSFAKQFRRHAFLYVGFVSSPTTKHLVPYIGLTTNFYLGNQRWAAQAEARFHTFQKVNPDGGRDYVFSVGTPLERKREIRLLRVLRQNNSPSVALRLLTNEILKTSKSSTNVGRRVLCACIPRKSVERRIETNWSHYYNHPANLETATYHYFDRLTECQISKGPASVGGDFYLDSVTSGSL